MSRTREQIQEERRKLKAEYGALFDSVAKLMFDTDPMRINFEINPDEYHPEVGTILPRLNSCRSEDDALRVVHEEFVHWFGGPTAGEREGYRQIASEIWGLWMKRKGQVSNSQV